MSALSAFLGNLLGPTETAGREKLVDFMERGGGNLLCVEPGKLVREIFRLSDDLQNVPLNEANVMFRKAFAPRGGGDVAVDAQKHALDEDRIQFLRGFRDHPGLLSFLLKMAGVSQTLIDEARS